MNRGKQLTGDGVALPKLDARSEPMYFFPTRVATTRSRWRSSLTSAVPSTITNANGGCGSSTVRATRLSRCKVRPFTLDALVVNWMTKDSGVPSAENQTGATCGLPSALVEATCAVRVPQDRNSKISGGSSWS
jgi:hypothetical protein